MHHKWNRIQCKLSQQLNMPEGLCTYECFGVAWGQGRGSGVGGGGRWGLDQQNITSPRNLTEHFDTVTGP